jgi:hypothetical protein
VRIVVGRTANRLVPFLLALVLSGLLAAAALATAPAGRTYVTSGCEGAALKPRSIVLACGDAGLVARKLQWTQWGASQAHGAGLGEEKICNPNCAEGRVGKGAMKLTLSRPRLCSQDGKHHFTKVHYVWPADAPGEGPKQGTIPLPCALLSS